MNTQYVHEKKIKKMQGRDFTYNWVSSSVFLYYLHLVCIAGFLLGACYMLYTKRFNKPDVHIQESSRYVPNYK